MCVCVCVCACVCVYVCVFVFVYVYLCVRVYSPAYFYLFEFFFFLQGARTREVAAARREDSTRLAIVPAGLPALMQRMDPGPPSSTHGKKNTYTHPHTSFLLFLPFFLLVVVF